MVDINEHESWAIIFRTNLYEERSIFFFLQNKKREGVFRECVGEQKFWHGS